MRHIRVGGVSHVIIVSIPPDPPKRIQRRRKTCSRVPIIGSVDVADEVPDWRVEAFYGVASTESLCYAKQHPPLPPAAAGDFSSWRKGKNSQMKGDRAQGKHLQAFHLRHLRSVIGFWKGKNHSDLLHPNSFVFAPFFFSLAPCYSFFISFFINCRPDAKQRKAVKK
jgi:hypothetical protein